MDASTDREYGLRVSYQSEDVRIEAAEFLVATRARHEGQLRVARDLAILRAEHHVDQPDLDRQDGQDGDGADGDGADGDGQVTADPGR